MGTQPHCEGEARTVTITDDDVLHSGSLLPEVLFLPPRITCSVDDATPSPTNSKVHELTYYDQIWFYSALEAFQYGISKEDFDVISNLQRLDIINALEKLEPIRLFLKIRFWHLRMKTLQTLINLTLTSLLLLGDKMTKSFLPHGVSSKAQMAEVIKSINHLGENIMKLDTAVKHVANNVKDQTTAASACISSLLESQNALSQRLTALEAN